MKHPASAIAITLLAACGGSGTDTPNSVADNPAQNAPAAPDAQERAEFAAGKIREDTFLITLPMNHITDYTTADGHVLLKVSMLGWGTKRWDASKLPQGFATVSGRVSETGNFDAGTFTARSYQGFRGGVLTLDGADDETTYGDYTAPAQLPAAGKATYQGVAFDREHQGTLTYHIDFAEKTGHGVIENLPAYGTLHLDKGGIHTNDAMENASEISGTAAAAGGQTLNYRLHVFGNRAEEIAGYAEGYGKDTVIFHGTRGAIATE